MPGDKIDLLVLLREEEVETLIKRWAKAHCLITKTVVW